MSFMELQVTLAYLDLDHVSNMELDVAIEYGRLIPPNFESDPCPDTTAPAESTPPANNAAEPTDADDSAPTAE